MTAVEEPIGEVAKIKRLVPCTVFHYSTQGPHFRGFQTARDIFLVIEHAKQGPKLQAGSRDMFDRLEKKRLVEIFPFPFELRIEQPCEGWLGIGIHHQDGEVLVDQPRQRQWHISPSILLHF